MAQNRGAVRPDGQSDSVAWFYRKYPGIFKHQMDYKRGFGVVDTTRPPDGRAARVILRRLLYEDYDHDDLDAS